MDMVAESGGAGQTALGERSVSEWLADWQALPVGSGKFRSVSLAGIPRVNGEFPRPGYYPGALCLRCRGWLTWDVTGAGKGRRASLRCGACGRVVAEYRDRPDADMAVKAGKRARNPVLTAEQRDAMRWLASGGGQDMAGRQLLMALDSGQIELPDADPDFGRQLAML